MRLRGEVHDGVDALALDDVPHGVAITNVNFHESESLVCGDRLETGHVTGVRKRIQPHDLVGRMMLDPELDEIAADESGRACYEHPTHGGERPQRGSS